MSTALLQLDCTTPTVSVAGLDAAQTYLLEQGGGNLCVPPFWVKRYRRELGQASAVQLLTCVGYPYGYQRTETKIAEIEQALLDGADECEVMFNASALYSPSASWLKIEFAKIAQLLHGANRVFTVVVEPSWLSDTELLRKVGKYASDAGADFVKIGTGLYALDAIGPEHIRPLLAPAVGLKMLIPNLHATLDADVRCYSWGSSSL